MKDDLLKMYILVNGLSVGIWEKISLKMAGKKIDLEFGNTGSKKKITLEAKNAAALCDRITKVKVPLFSAGAPKDGFDGVIFDTNIENRNGKMHFRWVDKAAGLEDLQVLIAEIMKYEEQSKK